MKSKLKIKGNKIYKDKKDTGYSFKNKEKPKDKIKVYYEKNKIADYETTKEFYYFYIRLQNKLNYGV